MFGRNLFYFEFGYSVGGNLVFIFTVMCGLGTLISQCVFHLLTNHFSRNALLEIFTSLICASYIAFLSAGFVLPMNAAVINVTGFIIFFSQGIFRDVLNMVLLVMLNNSVEYDEYKFHERHDSIISTVRSFTAKLGSALDQGIVNLVLILSGIYLVNQKRFWQSVELSVQKKFLVRLTE